MRYIKYFLYFVIALVLITVFFANRQIVTLTILPQTLDGYVGLNGLVGPLALPLWAVALGGVAIGLILGFTWEWFREYKHRRDANAGRQTKAELEAKVRKMKAKENAGKDEVLVLVEETASAR